MASVFSHRITPIVIITFAAVFALMCAGVVTAWTGPSGTAPNSNVSAPINVGTASQIKDGALGANSLAVYGNTYVQGTLGVGVTTPSYKLDVSGDIRASGQVISTSANAFRMVYGNYGAFWRNDGSNTYLLFTASGDQYGGWNTLRPLYVNNVSGNVTSGTQITAPAFYYSSDVRLKHNIETLSGLSTVLKLRGVSFNWNESGKSSVGLIAQEVEQLLPQVVTTDPETGMKSVQYGNLVAPLIEAVKEQQAEIQHLQKQQKNMEARIEALEARI